MSNVTTRARSLNDVKARKNAESPFLRLPLELKTRIYEFVCGGQTIHIDQGKRGLSCDLCVESLSEEEAQKKFDTSEAVWYAPETADRHVCCYPHSTPNVECAACTSHLKPRRPPTANLGTNLLSCCRQMYLESKFVPYYANTFSFYSAILLSQFCRQIPETYRSAIRSLHVDLSFGVGGYEDTQYWSMAFQTVTTSLKRLQRLYINMELCSSKTHSFHEDQEKSLLSLVLQAGKLDLKVATAVLCDSHFKHEWFMFNWSNDEKDEYEMRERWTLAQKQEWSRYLRKALLHYEDRDSDLSNLRRAALEQGRICRL